MKNVTTIPTKTPPAPKWLSVDGKHYWKTNLSFRCQAASANTPSSKKFVNGLAFMWAQDRDNA